MAIAIFKLTTAIFLVYVVNIVYSFKSNPKDEVHDYDMFTLAISWSPTKACINFYNNHSETTCGSCKLPKSNNKWTIHGLWPSNRHGDHPFYCSNVTFDANLLSEDLKSQMKVKWPGGFNWTDEYYWSIEWAKHGTCANLTKETDTMVKYFTKTVELYDQYDIHKILDNGGIVPSKKYQTEDIHRALKNSLGVNTFLACIPNQQFQQQFIREVHICFDKSFSLVDCEDNNKYLISCSRSYEVTYLESC